MSKGQIRTEVRVPNINTGRILIDVVDEIERARQMFPDVHSFHHGLGVMEEEVWELRMEVYKKGADRDKDKMRREAVQVAATAIRFIEELL